MAVARPEISGRRITTTATGDLDDVFSVEEFYRRHAELDAYSIDEFCRRHSISVPFYYKLREDKLTPDEIELGSRVLVSRESAAKWRAQRTAETAAKRREREAANAAEAQLE